MAPAPAPAAAPAAASPTTSAPAVVAPPPAADIANAATASAAVAVTNDEVKLTAPGKDNHFTFTVTFPVPKVGELFSAQTLVTDARTGQPIADGKLTLDATMPEHGHGMMTKPEHRRIDGDRWRTDGMKLHMPGKWQIEVKFEAGGQSDGATFDWEQPAEAER